MRSAERGVRSFPQSCGVDELLSQSRSWLIGEAEGGGMGDFAELLLNGGIDPRMIMPVEISPNGRIGIQIFLPVSIPQNRAIARSNDNRLALQPIAHLRERMPDIFMVK